MQEGLRCTSFLHWKHKWSMANHAQIKCLTKRDLTAVNAMSDTSNTAQGQDTLHFTCLLYVCAKSQAPTLIQPRPPRWTGSLSRKSNGDLARQFSTIMMFRMEPNMKWLWILLLEGRSLSRSASLGTCMSTASPIRTTQRRTSQIP